MTVFTKTQYFIGIFIVFGIFTLYYLFFHSRVSISTFIENKCDLSLKESDNFICEDDTLWNYRKRVYAIQDERNMMKINHRIFFSTNWEPNFHCSYSHRVGKMGDGGKWVCDPFRLKDRPDCLIYSVGSYGEFSFEIDLKQILPHCEIHTFDFDLYKCPTGICIFHQIKFGDGSHGSKTWAMILKELNHTNRLIDILKMYIENSEYVFLPQIFQVSQSIKPRQILIELHPNEVHIKHSLFEQLRDNQYVIFNKEPNLEAGIDVAEYAFLRLNSEFFRNSQKTIDLKQNLNRNKIVN